MPAPVCIDCIAEGITTARPIAAGCGPRTPRCVTHQRVENRRRRDLAHARTIHRGYEMSAEQYQLLYLFQGGTCFICQKAKGISKRLAVEHEHNKEGCTHPPDRGCEKCWRALVCGRCNRLVAFLDVDALCRAIVLLTDPPARKLFG
jgi:Recombination endonuclease VII